METLGENYRKKEKSAAAPEVREEHGGGLMGSGFPLPFKGPG